MDLTSIVYQFQFTGEIDQIVPFGSGHIHDTYLVKNQFADQPDYILQKINHHVFKNVEGMMSNMERITQQLQTKSGASQLSNIYLIKTLQGRSYISSENGFWRMMNFIPGSKTYDTAPNTAIAYEGAKKFGEFISDLSDLDPNTLVETIPDFHNVRKRFDQFLAALKEDPVNRAVHAQPEITYVKLQIEKVLVIQNLKEKGLIPLRITHNDTKINNVLFNSNDKGLCVVDLDTVMPGVIHFDFGDGIRACANTGKEDDENLKNVSLDLAMFEAFSSGFLESTAHLLTDEEKNTLVHSVVLFPFLMGLRFLTDYISADVYYKTEYEDHNLIRAKAQLKLAMDAKEKLNEMDQVIKKILNSL